MSIKIMTLVWESNVGPATKRLILLALADSANDEGVCWPSIRTLKTKAQCGQTTAEDALRSLDYDGLVKRDRRFNDTSVYTINVAKLTTPEYRGTPEIQGDPPPKSGDTPPEKPRNNRKGTQKEPSSSDAAAPGEQAALIPEPPKPSFDEENPAVKTLNQRAVLLAQNQYERLGKMGNVAAFSKIIRKALEHEYTDDQVDKAVAYIAENRWTLTEERLANTLRGGPKKPSRSPQAAGRVQATTANGMRIER